MSNTVPPPLRSVLRRQKDRVVEVLMASLSSQLVQEAAAEGLSSLVVVPEAVDYWIVNAPDSVEVLSHRDVTVFVGSQGATAYPIRLSGDGRVASMMAETQIAVVLLFKQPAGYPSITRRGRILQEAEIVELMADVYRAAIFDVMLRDGADGVDILDVMVTSDFADAITPDQNAGAMGRAVLNFTLTGQGEHPQPQYSLTREAP